MTRDTFTRIFRPLTARRTISFLLVMMYGVALIRPAFPLLEYYLRYDAYLEQCVNRDRPALQCHGQCMLTRKLQAQHDTAETPTAPAPAQVNFQEYPVGFVTLCMPVFGDEGTANISLPPPAGLVMSNHAADIFHPPIA